MKYEKQLDEALKYLRDNIQEEGKFLYYEKWKADHNKQEHYLYKHFQEAGIAKNFWLPMVYYLADDKYIELAYDPAEDEAAHNPPNQLKITFKGIMFINEGGYEQKATDDRISRELRDSRDKRLSNGTVYLAIGTFLLVLVEALIHRHELLSLFSCH
ncbi:MAG: hypothetical protein M0Q26_08595 [Chitinophagaceae bacterium]|nr:hypothetical protein [Chitinophagaceae bacterium]